MAELNESGFRLSKGELNAIVGFASTDKTRPQLNCAAFDFARKAIYSCDGHSLLKVELAGEAKGDRVMVPLSVILRAMRVMEKRSTLVVPSVGNELEVRLSPAEEKAKVSFRSRFASVSAKGSVPAAPSQPSPGAKIATFCFAPAELNTLDYDHIVSEARKPVTRPGRGFSVNPALLSRLEPICKLWPAASCDVTTPASAMHPILCKLENKVTSTVWTVVIMPMRGDVAEQEFKAAEEKRRAKEIAKATRTALKKGKAA